MLIIAFGSVKVHSAILNWNTLQKDGTVGTTRNVYKMKYRLMKVECICGLAERTNIVDAIARKYSKVYL